MVAFYGRKGHPKAGLLQEQGIQASQAIATIPTWMGYPATWRTRCVSVAEANEIVTACKRLERENWRRARWELQQRFSAMRLGSSFSAVAKPFQPQAASSATLVASPPRGSVDPAGPRGNSPAAAAIETPIHRGSPIPHQVSDEGETSPDTSTPDRTSRRRRARRGNRSRYSDSDSEDSHASVMSIRRRMGSRIKSRSLNLEVRKDILMMWPAPLGNGRGASPITGIIMRTPTSCLWWCLP